MRRIRLFVVELAYRGGLALHTATSGVVPGLREFRLVVEAEGRLAALGATRTNIAYLTGVPQAVLECEIMEAAPRLDWHLPWTDFIAALPPLSAPARMLFEMAAQDGAARDVGIPLAQALGGAPGRGTHTNQTLFWCDDATLLRRAEAYVARGFTELKLRIAVADFADDVRRLRLLRDRFGDAIALSADANGRWSVEDAPARLNAVAELGLDYVEQPLPPADWADAARISAASPIPLMFDESLDSMAAVERLAETRAVPLAHVKLAKLGGLDRLMRAARVLQQAGIDVMVGQMNEGVVSTYAAAAAATALGVRLRELYGADDLAHDPAGVAEYGDGQLRLPAGPGLGCSGHAEAGAVLMWEQRA